MIPEKDKPKKVIRQTEENGKINPRKSPRDRDNNEKFSPGEPDDYNAEEFATD